MKTKWESLIVLARDVDRDCAAGRQPDFIKVARLARTLIDFHVGLAPGVRVAPASEPPNGAATNGVDHSKARSAG